MRVSTSKCINFSLNSTCMRPRENGGHCLLLCFSLDTHTFLYSPHNKLTPTETLVDLSRRKIGQAPKK